MKTMNEESEDDGLVRIALIILNRLSTLGHKYEHVVHLIYFAALSTGAFSYHYAAMACLLFGIMAMFPQEV